MDTSGNTTEQTPKSVTDKLKENSLRAAGIAYLIGDAAIVASGLVEGNIKRASVGAAWGAGGLFPAFFGNPTQEKQLELIGRKLGGYLRKQGVEIPKDPTIAKLTKEGGIADHTKDFFYHHPSEALNAIYAIGAGQLVAAGMTNNVKSGKGASNADIASGLLVGAGALSGLLIKEKKPDSDKRPKDALGKIKAWAQEKPLRVSGLLYHANNISMVAGAYSQWKEARGKVNASKNYRWRFLTAGAYIFANTMLALSSKGHGGSEKSDVSAAAAELAAKIIAVQPQEVQEALVQNVAGYLSAQPEIGKTAQEIAFLMHEKLATVGRQPMAQQPSWQQRLQAVMSQPDSPHLS